MTDTANQDKFQYFCTKFQDILRSSQILMMNQVADIIEDNKFDHVSFLGKTQVSDVIENIYPLSGETNTVIQDKYSQLFITRKIFDENNDIFLGKELGGNYVVVEDYSEVFRGLVRCDQYFILANSSQVTNKYPVYALIDSLEQANITVNSQDKKFEFYGFIRLGYLINPRGYTSEELDLFEKTIGFTLRPEIKSYVSKTSILRHDNRLFHINLDLSTYSSSMRLQLESKFGFLGEKTISNNKFLSRYRSSSPGLEYNQVLKEEDEFLRSLTNGFLYLGSLKKQILLINDNTHIKSDKRVYLLLNYDDCGNVNYNFSIWTYLYDNKNFDKIIDFYDDQGEKENDEEPELDLKQENIYQTLKLTTNLFFE